MGAVQIPTKTTFAASWQSLKQMAMSFGAPRRVEMISSILSSLPLKQIILADSAGLQVDS